MLITQLLCRIKWMLVETISAISEEDRISFKIFRTCYRPTAED